MGSNIHGLHIMIIIIYNTIKGPYVDITKIELLQVYFIQSNQFGRVTIDLH